MEHITSKLVSAVVLCCVASVILIHQDIYCRQMNAETVVLQYQANWSNLKVGMSKDEVVNLLGESPSKSQPGKIQASPDSNMLQTYIGMTFVKYFIPDLWRDLCYERWHYGEFEMLENLVFPSDKAYVVYFGSSGKVVSFREPIHQGSKDERR